MDYTIVIYPPPPPPPPPSLSHTQLLVSAVSYVFPDFHFQWLARQVRTNLPNELDFKLEAANQEKFSEMFKHLHFIKAPLVYWKYTSSRVLTMEFCEGGKLDDLSYIKEHGLPVDEVCVCVCVSE